jgi:heptose I phosphotransferase
VIEIAEGWLPRVASLRLDDPERLVTIDIGVLAKPAHGGRETRRIETEGGIFYLKRYLSVKAPGRFSLFVRRTASGPATREWHALLAFRRAGLPVPEPVLVFERVSHGRADGCLLTCEVPAKRKLEALLLAGVDEPRLLRWAERLGTMARRMHDAGLNHRDFYAGHILVGEGPPGEEPFYLIDLNRADVRASVPLRWRVKDLAALHFSIPERAVPASTRLRFLAAYAKGKSRSWLKSFARKILRKTTRIRRHVTKKVLRGDENVHLNRIGRDT